MSQNNLSYVALCYKTM